MKREELSDQGVRRRKEILADALHAADRRRRGRVAVRCGAAAAVIVAAVLTTIRLREPSGSSVAQRPVQTTRPATQSFPTATDDRPAPPLSPTVPLVAHAPGTTVPITPSLVRIEIVRPGDVVPRWERIDEDQLLNELAAAGQPSGIVAVNGVATAVPVR